MDLYELRSDLDAWARWKASGSAINSCTLGRLNNGGGGVPGSRPPPGVELRPRVAAVIEGMEVLPLFQDVGEAFLVLRVIYQRGHNASLEDCAETLGMSMTRLKAARKVGESCLLGWMAAKGF